MHTESPLLALFREFAARVREESFLTLSEGLVKVRLLHAAINLGWIVQEGAPGTTYGKPVADFARKVDGVVRWRRDQRKIRISRGSCDLAVVDPFDMLLEIKTRSDYGTKSGAQFDFIKQDVVRASGDDRVAFWFVFDPKIYRSFSGEKIEARGRPTQSNRWFCEYFVPYHLAIAGPVLRSAEVEGVHLSLAFCPLPCEKIDSRVAVLGCRGSSKLCNPIPTET